MGGVSPETYWASYKYEIKFWYTVACYWIFFVNYTVMHGFTSIKLKKCFEYPVFFTLVNESSIVVAVKIVILLKMIWSLIYPSLRRLNSLQDFTINFSKTKFILVLKLKKKKTTIFFWNKGNAQSSDFSWQRATAFRANFNKYIRLWWVRNNCEHVSSPLNSFSTCSSSFSSGFLRDADQYKYHSFH